MELVYRSPAELTEYIRNPRKNDSAVASVAASIKEFGFKQPIVIDSENVIVAGHTRLKAARQLGLDKVPCVLADDLTPQQVKAYRLLDNRVGEIAEWDSDLLALELADINDFDLSAFEVDFDEFLPEPPDAVQDEVPAVQADVVSRELDIWELGPHRLMCGDATSAQDVRALLGDVVPFIMVTDPPYGVNYDAAWRMKALDMKSVRQGLVTNDDSDDWAEAYRLFPGSVAYIWHSALHTGPVFGQVTDAGYVIRSQLLWVKQRFAISRGHYHWQHENCWYAVRKGATAKWCGDRTQSTIWNIVASGPFGGQLDDADTEHSTQKPVECMARPLRNHGTKDDDVYDPFVGSGTTIIAAEQLGRRCFAMEIAPQYVDVGVRRWQNFSQLEAVHVLTGKTFVELEHERRASGGAAA